MRYGLHARKLSPHCNTLRESRCWLIRAGSLSTRETNQPGGILARKPSIDLQSWHPSAPQYSVSSTPKLPRNHRKMTGRMGAVNSSCCRGVEPDRKIAPPAVASTCSATCLPSASASGVQLRNPTASNSCHHEQRRQIATSIQRKQASLSALGRRRHG